MTELRLAALESFYVGGARRPCFDHLGRPDETIAGAMYVQRLLPAERRLDVPVIMVHGGCHTGATWETTPDGREGWAILFARAGIDTYVVDQPLRGRSAIEADQADEPRKASFSTITMFARGGPRFPHAASEHYAAQLVPDYGVGKAVAAGHPGMSDPRALPAFIDLVDRIGRVVLVTHSQGAHIGWQLARARPDMVAAILSIEPGVTRIGLGEPEFPEIPVCIMWGDNLPDEDMVLSMQEVQAAKEIAAGNPQVCVDHLPEAGITGNGHMLMMEDNSAELSERAIAWITDKVGS